VGDVAGPTHRQALRQAASTSIRNDLGGRCCTEGLRRFLVFLGWAGGVDQLRQRGNKNRLAEMRGILRLSDFFLAAARWDRISNFGGTRGRQFG